MPREYTYIKRDICLNRRKVNLSKQAKYDLYVIERQGNHFILFIVIYPHRILHLFIFYKPSKLIFARFWWWYHELCENDLYLSIFPLSLFLKSLFLILLLHGKSLQFQLYISKSDGSWNINPWHNQYHSLLYLRNWGQALEISVLYKCVLRNVINCVEILD